MELLIAGLVVWTVVHLIPAAGLGVKASLIRRVGPNAYKGLFSLVIVLSLLMIVFGWRSSQPSQLYVPPQGVQPLASVLMLVAMFLFVASNLKTRLKRIIRHPQMLSVIIWSAAHLIVNGEDRSLILFGGLGLWAALEIVFINKRDGQWVKPAAPSWSQEAVLALVGLVAFIATLYLHPYLSGVALI